jgi:hypothetical protein
MRQRHDASDFYDPRFINGQNGQVVTQILAGTFTPAVPLAFAYALDPGGAGRKIIPPLETSSKGLWFYVINTADAAEDITVRNNADGADRGVISQNESALLICDGVTWNVLVGKNT